MMLVFFVHGLVSVNDATKRAKLVLSDDRRVWLRYYEERLATS